jgi:hypothetical protein
MNEKEIKQWIKELEKENNEMLSYGWKRIFNEGKIEVLKVLLEDFEK